MCDMLTAIRPRRERGFVFPKAFAFTSYNCVVSKAPDGFTHTPHVLADAAKARTLVGSFALMTEKVDLSKIGRRAGYVYLMLAPDGRYKIGESIDVKSRKSALEREFGCKLKLVATVLSIDRFENEAEFHGIFRDKRLDREWFALDSGDLAEFYDFARFMEKPCYILLEMRKGR